MPYTLTDMNFYLKGLICSALITKGVYTVSSSSHAAIQYFDLCRSLECDFPAYLCIIFSPLVVRSLKGAGSCFTVTHTIGLTQLFSEIHSALCV